MGQPLEVRVLFRPSFHISGRGLEESFVASNKSDSPVDCHKSIDEANEVLRISPDNQEALLVKADALGWQGNFRRAIPVYRKILKRDGPFDARLGLSYALLSSGNQAAASRNAFKKAPVQCLRGGCARTSATFGERAETTASLSVGPHPAFGHPLPGGEG